jgi:hypothetical protein
VILPTWVLKRFKEIAAVDSDSTTFRYGERYLPCETYVSLPHLRRAMACLNAVLVALVDTGELPRGTDSIVLLERAYIFDLARERDAFVFEETG